ncbi:MAG: hypothetical protein LBI53_06715 [Candidatus Peribacteria bacterium]|jgi:hypothetical protein|nr:hypothetical protein [Candidatus Peribacteria bacterium]
MNKIQKLTTEAKQILASRRTDNYTEEQLSFCWLYHGYENYYPENYLKSLPVTASCIIHSAGYQVHIEGKVVGTEIIENSDIKLFVFVELPEKKIPIFRKTREELCLQSNIMILCGIDGFVYEELQNELK